MRSYLLEPWYRYYFRAGYQIILLFVRVYFNLRMLMNPFSDVQVLLSHLRIIASLLHGIKSLRYAFFVENQRI